MNGRCHCGAVTIEVPGRPEKLNLCNCSVCFTLGTLWAYYPRSQVAIGGTPRGYARADMAAPRLSFNFCETCGATTHWSYLDPHGPDRAGVNMRLFDPADLAGIEVEYENSREEHPGAPERYREASIFTASGATA
ncbi:GFA family protein [Sphingomonas profundi]|uniref:GFA family protein n=1 Tax=Alterirhizorhabdus profundi TaxID=2681549 RepID=UPI0018D077BA|nr:aldehyde-activating protein [Sphingomonas profundi]